MMYITCLIGLAPANNPDFTSPINPLLRKTCCVKLYNRRSSGMSIRLKLPEISDPLYCPPCPRPAGKRSFGALGARPELLTIMEEFSTPVPLPFPTMKFCPTTAIAAGYWPVGIKPFSLDFYSPLCASATTATALLCALATKSVFSSALNARLGAAARQGSLGEAHVDAFDLPVRRRVNYRDAVGVRVDDVQARLRRVENHRRRMAIHRNAPDRLARIVRIVRVNHRHRGVIPARDVNFGRFAVPRGQNRDAVRIYGLRRIVASQIHANEFAHPAHVANNAQAIAEVVGHEESLAVRSERQAGRVNGREISVVSRRGRLRGKAIDVNERRFDASVRPRRGRSDRRARARGEPEHPDFVLDAAGDI